MSLIANNTEPEVAPYTLAQYKQFCRLVIDRNGSELFCFLKLIDSIEIETALWDSVSYSDIDKYGNNAHTKGRRDDAIKEFYDVGVAFTQESVEIINNMHNSVSPAFGIEAWQELSEVEQSFVKTQLSNEAIMALEIE